MSVLRLFLLATVVLRLSALPSVPTDPLPLDAATNVVTSPLLGWGGGTNLLENGGFEDEFSGWILSPPSPGAGRLITVAVHQSSLLQGRQVLPLEGNRMSLLRIYEPGYGSLRREFVVPDTGRPVRLIFAEWVVTGQAGAPGIPWFDGAYGVELLEIPSPTAAPVFLRHLRPFLRSTSIQQGWVRRSIDITEFAGRRVEFRVSARFVFRGVEALIDDLRLEVGNDQGPEYEVRIGSEPAPGPGDLLMTTRETSALAEGLRPGSTNFWQVIARDGSGTNAGPVWKFTVSPRGPAQSLVWEELQPPLIAGYATAAGFAAQDAAGNASGEVNGTAKLVVLEATTQVPKVLLSEMQFSSSPNSGSPYVEVANVGTNTFNLAGWKVTVWDQPRWPEPVGTVVFPANASLSAGRVATVRSGGSGAGSFPILNLAKPFYWTLRSTNQLAAALLQDPAGMIVDFVSVGGADPSAIRNPVAVPAWQWIGPSLPGITNRFSPPDSWQRLGGRDTHSADDWFITLPTSGMLNRNVSRPFEPSAAGHEVLPAEVILTNGVWRGELQFPVGGDTLELIAFSTNGLVGRRVVAVNSNPPVRVELPTRLREDAGTVAGAGRVTLTAPAAAEVPVQLVSSSTFDVQVPAVIVIPAGANEAQFDVTVADDAWRDGTVTVKVTPSAPGYTSVPGQILVDDNESAVLGLILPGSVIEGGPSGACFVTVSPPPERDLTVRILAEMPASPPYEIHVAVPSGAERALFRIPTRDDTRLDGPRSINVLATVENWTSASGSLALVDDDRKILVLSLPPGLTETDEILTNAGGLSLGGSVATNVTVGLVSSNPRRIQVPAEVVVPAGHLTVSFDVAFVDNELLDGDEVVTITASADGFGTAPGQISTADNDAAAFVIEAVPSPQLAEREIVVRVQALGTNGEPVFAFQGPLNFTLQDPSGSSPAVVASLAYLGGSWAEARMIVEAVGTDFRFVTGDGRGHRGESNPFELIEPPYRSFAGSVSDVAWDAKSARLYVGVLGDAASGTGSRIAAFDPVTRRETGSVALVPAVGQLAISSGSEFLYAVVAGGAGILQYSLPGLELVRNWNVLGEDGNEAPVEDLAVQPGHPEVVAVTRYRADLVPRANGLVVYDQGVKRAEIVDAFTQRINRIEFSPAGDTLYGYENETTAAAFSHLRVNDEGVTLLDVRENVTRSVFGMDFSMHGAGVVFGNGEVHVPETGGNRELQFGGSDLAIATEVSRQRVYGVEGYGLGTRVRAFDFLSGNEVGAVFLPELYTQFGLVNRLVRWGPDGLAAVVGGRLAYWHSELVPSPDPVELAISAPLPPPSVVAGQTATLALILRNHSTAPAPEVNLTLPWGAFLLSEVAVWLNGVPIPTSWVGTNYFASLGVLPAGAEIELAVHFTPSQGGPLMLTGSVTAHAPEEIPGNNEFSVGTYAEVRVARGESALLKLTVDSLVANPVRPALYAGQANEHRIVELDPTTGRIVRSVDVDLAAPLDLLAVSAEGSRLYAASSTGSLIAVVDTESLTILNQFGLGPAPVQGPVLPRQLVVRPGSPEMVAVSVINPGSPSTVGLYGVSVYDHGVQIGSGQADFNLSRMAFSGDGQVLYGITPNSIPVGRRLRLTPGGLVDHGPIDRWVGTAVSDIATAGGRVYLSDIVFADDEAMTPLGRFPDLGVGAGAVLVPEAGLAFSSHPSQGSGRFTIYDLERLTPLTSLPAPALPETRGLVHWGRDGLAWWGSDTIALARTDWLPAGPELADLAITLETTGRPEVMGAPVKVKVRVQNRGPATATAVKLNWYLPVGILAVWPPGTVLKPDTEPATTEVVLGPLAAGGETNLTVTLNRHPNWGTWPLGVWGRSEAGDAITTNQLGVAFLEWASAGKHQQMPSFLPSVNDAVWDPSRRQFYLSLGTDIGRAGNTVVSFDPATGGFGQAVFLGSKPNRLALSDDGSRLYVALDGSSEVAVCELPSMEVTQRFPLWPSPDSTYLRTVRDSLVVPGQPTNYIASLLVGFGETSEPSAGVAFYRDGAKAPLEVAGSLATHLELGPESGTFWGADGLSPRAEIHRLTVGETGLQSESVSGGFPAPPGDFRQVGGWLVGTDGTVLNGTNGATWGRLAPFPTIDGTPMPTLVCAEPDGSRVYALPAHGAIFVHAFDPAGLSFLGQAETGVGSQLATGAFQRWGVDGLAFATPDGLWLVRSPLILASPTADWDEDGLSDSWEQANGTNPHVSDATDDPDWDGLDNAGEFIAGTVANDTASRLELRLTSGSDGGWQGEVFARTGRRYQLQSSGSAEGPWEPLGAAFDGADAPVSTPLPTSPENGTRLFRVLAMLP